MLSIGAGLTGDRVFLIRRRSFLYPRHYHSKSLPPQLESVEGQRFRLLAVVNFAKSLVRS